jgi:hypothetical protein
MRCRDENDHELRLDGAGGWEHTFDAYFTHMMQKKRRLPDPPTLAFGALDAHN